MMRAFLLLMCLMSVAGCRATARQARINDLAVPHPLNSGYQIVSVDGAPESRAAGKVATVIPMVLVNPGSHTFSVTLPRQTTPKTVTAYVEADKEYRIATKYDGTPILVEHTK